MRIKLLASSITLMAVVVLASCGSSHSTASTTKTTIGPQAPAPASTAAPAGGGECAGIAAKVKAHLTDASVTGVDVVGACSRVVVNTSLHDSGDAGTAADICTTAGEVAYTGQPSSVSVESASHKELAIGLKQAACLGEP